MTPGRQLAPWTLCLQNLPGLDNSSASPRNPHEDRIWGPRASNSGQSLLPAWSDICAVHPLATPHLPWSHHTSKRAESHCLQLLLLSPEQTGQLWTWGLKNQTSYSRDTGRLPMIPWRGDGE